MPMTRGIFCSAHSPCSRPAGQSGRTHTMSAIRLVQQRLPPSHRRLLLFRAAPASGFPGKTCPMLEFLRCLPASSCRGKPLPVASAALPQAGLHAPKKTCRLMRNITTAPIPVADRPRILEQGSAPSDATMAEIFRESAGPPSSHHSAACRQNFPKSRKVFCRNAGTCPPRGRAS